MATLITKPPALAGSSSRAAYTASSWRVAAAGARGAGGGRRGAAGRSGGAGGAAPPPPAAGKPRRLGGVRFRRHSGRKHVRDRMGMDGDQADRGFGRGRGGAVRDGGAGGARA